MAFWGSFTRVGVVSLLVLTTAACTKERIIEREKSAPQNMTASFSILNSDSCAKATCIKIQKDALGKIYLLMASGVTLGSAPQWYDLKPQVVSFRKNNTDVALVGENYNSIYKEIGGVNLIQSFRIVSEDESSITFDWGKGLTSFVAESPYDVDSPRGKTDLTETSVKAIPVVDSFVDNVKVTEKNIELTQLSKIRSISGKISQSLVLTNEEREESLTMNIQIRAYNLGANFKKKEYDKTRRVGFFVTKVSKPEMSQDLTNLITKWDLSPEKGPIVVRVSNAVPADYIQAVTEAVNYWNKVFGRETPGQEALIVRTGVDPQAGPEDRSIMIRWIPWMDAGAAYALGQSDPMTGEVLRAQVFMPAVFTRVGSSVQVELNGRSPVAAVNGAIACDFSAGVKDLTKLMAEAPDSQRLRLAQDSVRATVAHELGHALGLRHNFAGSFSSKVSLKDIDEATKTYLKDPKHQGLETSTSIMDYVGGIDNILMAARLKYAPLSYDKMAMDWAYADDDKALSEKVSLYCTDDDIGLANSQGMNIYGCERFDAGNNPLLRKFVEVKTSKDLMIPVLFASIINRLYPADHPEIVNNIDQVLEDTKKWGVIEMTPLDFVATLVNDRTVNGAPDSKFASLQSVKSGTVMYSKYGVDPALAKQVDHDLKSAEMGGYASLWKLALDDQNGLDLTWYLSQIDALKKSDYLKHGKTLGHREYALTDAEQEKIVKFFEGYAIGNTKGLINGLGRLVPKTNEVEKNAQGQVNVTTLVGNNLLTESDSQVVAQFVKSAFFTSIDLPVKVGEGLAKEVKIPARILSFEDRVKFMPLLSNVSMRVPMASFKTSIRQILVSDIVTYVKSADESVNPETMTLEQLAKMPEDLLQKGLIDARGAKWLSGDLKLLITLDLTK